MDFSLMFWGDLSLGTSGPDYYKFLLDACRYADDNDFTAVWLPERHFHPWGGAHPNPSVLAGAVAAATKNIRIRSGSVVMPLHHPLRVAEEWSLVDNLSNGRVELSLATGWKDDDFVFAPEKYAKRKENFAASIKTLQGLWQGEPFPAVNGSGVAISVRALPRPVQPDVPIWITSAGSLRTISSAGGSGFHLLTHLLGQDVATLEKSIGQFKAYRVRNDCKTPGKVALMLHTFVGKDDAEVRNTVKKAMSNYLMNSADLIVPVDKRAEWETLGTKVKEDMMDLSFERYFQTASLMGTLKTCQATIQKLKQIGVTEVCCLVDFGVEPRLVMESLSNLKELKDSVKTL